MAVNITPDSKKNVTTTPDSRKNVTINTETKKVTVNTQSDNSVANNVSVPSGDTYVNVTPDSNKNVTATTETKQVSVSTQSVNSVSVSSERTTSVVNVTALGPQGIQGPQGIAGPTGSLGPLGPEGPTGAQGIQGIAGPSGSAFFTGGEIRSDTSVTGSFTVSSSNVDFSDTTSITGSVFTGIFQGALSSSEQISSNISGSTNSLSSSLSTRLTTAESELDNTLISSSAQISTDISGSFIEPSSSFSTRITTAETELSNTLISSSAQISTDISGSFTQPSASISTRLTTAESELSNTLISSSAQISTDISGSFIEPSSSFSTRITTAETELSNTLISGSTQITQLGFVSESFSTGGTGIISGSEQLPAGLVSGSAQSVTHITGADLDMGGNKVLFSNVYSTEGDLPSASTYHGMFAHVHATGRGYFAHAGAWHPLVNLSEGVISGSAQISTDISGSFTAPSASISTRLTTAESELSNTLISSSAQIAIEISGSFTSPSASISTRLTTAETELSNTLISSSAQIASDISGSFGNQRVGTTDNVNFASVTTSGNVNVGGNLDVSGTTTSIDSATLNIGDKNITIGSGSTTSAQLDEAGIDFGLGGDVSNLRYRHSDTSITSSVDFRAPNFYGIFNGALSSSAQISSDISGSFTAASSSFSTRITTAETELGNTLISSSAQVDHDTTTNFVSNEHIDHSGVTLTAGDGLSGGGDITTNRSFAVDNSVLRTTGDNVVTSSAQISTDISGSFIGELSGSHTKFVGGGVSGSSISTGSFGRVEIGGGGIDTAGDLTLDGDGGDIIFKDGGTEFGRMTQLLGGLTIKTGPSGNAAIIFDGDGNQILGGTISSQKNISTTTTGSFGKVIIGEMGNTDVTSVSSSISTRLTTAESELGNTLISSSAQISTDISGSFTAPSASISTRLTTAETELSNTLVSSSVQVDHDATTNFVANEHIDHSTVSISAGGILSGGGTIASNRTITLASSDVVHDSTSGFVSNEHIDHTSITLTAGDGLSGGGDISSNRSFTVDNTVLRTTGDNVLSGSAQIATDISGSFVEVSSSLASRISSNETGNITSVTAGNGLTGGGSSGGVTLNVVGGTGIDANSNDIAIDSTVTTLTGTQTLTNKTLTSPSFTGDIDFSDANTPKFTVTDTTNNVKTEIRSQDSTGYIGTTSDHNLGIIRNGVGQITLFGAYTMHNNGGNDIDFRAKDSNGNVVFKVDAGDSKTHITTLDVSGDADIDGTLETDALTIGGVTSVPFESADHTKLDGIEASATADQTNAEIRTAVEAATDSNVFTDTDHSKLNAIEASADVTDTGNVHPILDAKGVISSSNQISSDVSGSFTAGTGLDLSSGEFSVDVSDFMTNGSNNRILTATGTDGQNAEANFTIDGTSLQLGDGKILSLGNSDDLQIHHTTNQNIVELNTGNLTFRDESDNNIMRINKAGGVDILEGNLTVAGNLDVQGTTTTIDSTEVSLGDRILTLNAGSAAGDGGLYVNDASTAETGSLLWDVSEDRWIGGLKDSEVNLVTISSTDTLTNKTINASNNTLSNIGNSSLTNSSINYGGVSVSLGGSDTTPAFDLSDATSLPIVAGTSGTLSVARGGTGATTFTSNKLLTGNGTSAIQSESTLTYDAGQLEIHKDGSNAILQLRSDDANTRIHFKEGSSVKWNVGYDASNNKFSFYAGATVFAIEDGAGANTLVVDSNSRVGIGTASPTYELDVVGNAGIDGALYHNGDTDTYLLFDTDRIRLVAGGSTKFDSNNTYLTSVDLTSNVTGTLPVANGGTGATTLTSNRVLTGNGTSAIQAEGNLSFNGSELGVTGNVDITGAYQTNNVVAINSDGNFEVHDNRATSGSTDLGFKGVRFDFKNNSADGLSDGGTYHGLMTFQQWNDTSGGHTHNLGFTDNGYIYHRNASIGGSWGNWKKLIQEDESGNVGIGTNSPASNLHIQEATAGTPASTFASALSGSLIIEDDSTPTANNILIKSHGVGDGNAIGGLKFVSSPDGGNYSWAGIQGLVSTFARAGQLAFYTAASNTAGVTSTERMRIDASGKVGIGTTSPLGHLDINTESAETTSVYINGEANQDKLLLIRHHSNSEAAGALQYAGFIGSVVDNVLTLGHYDSSASEIQALNIAEDGNVGIGTNSPDTLLHLNEDDNAVAFKVTGGNGGAKIASFIRDIGVASPYAETYIHAGSGDPQITFRDVGNTTYSIGLDDSANAFKISEHTGVGTNDRIVVNDSGTVYIPSSVRANGLGLGIGDNTPQNTLHVDATTSSNVVARFNTDNTFTFIDLYNDDTNRVQLGNADDGDFIIRTNDAERFRVEKTTGDVIIKKHLELPYGEINDAGTDLNIVGTNAVTLQTSAGTAITIPNASTNVGIGTTPSTKVHVKDASNDLYLRLETDKTNGNAQVQYFNDAQQYNLGINNADKFSLWDNTASETRFDIATDGDFKFYASGSNFESVGGGTGNTYLMLSGNATQRIEFRNTDTNANGWIGIPSWNTDAWHFYGPTSNGNEIAYVYESSRHYYYKGFTINNSGDDYDFIVKGQNDDTLLYTDASTDRVGIGTNSIGELLHVDGSIEFAGRKYNRGTVSVAGAGSGNGQAITLSTELGTTLHVNYQYKITLNTTGTGTDTGAVYILTYDQDGGAWDLHLVSRNGSSSNHPLAIVDGSNLKAYHNHSGTYNILYFVELWDMSADDGTLHGWGADYQWTRDVDTLSYSAGDVNIDSGTFYVDVSANRVGLLDTSPDATLQIGSGTDAKLFHADGNLNDVTFSGGSQGTNGVWEFVNSGTYAQTRMYVQDANNVAGRLTFDFRGNAGSNKILAGDSTGKVGVGTTSPLGVLNVIVPTFSNRDTDAQQVIIANSGDAGKGLRIGYDNSGHKAYMNVLDPGVAWGDLILQDGAGKIGIGTASPGGKLDIKGSVSANNLTISADMHTVGGGHLSNYQTVLFKNTTNNTGYAAIRHFANSHNDSASQLRFLTSNTSGTMSNQMTIDDTGYVGIGTTTPGEKLHVAGNSFINGQLYGGFGAQTTGGTTDWNHSTNARSGNGHTLLLSTHTNGPGTTTVNATNNHYYHLINFEYASYDSDGNMTQLAFPYSMANQDGARPVIRTRYGGTWCAYNSLVTANANGQIQAGMGTEALPSYTFNGGGTSDTDTGIYRRAANQIGFSVAAHDQFYVSDGSINVEQPVRIQFANDQRIYDNGSGGLNVGAQSHELILYSGGTDPIEFRFGGRSGTTKAIFNSSGQLLIGDTSVHYTGVDLQVGSTSDGQNGIQIQTSTTGYGYVLFGDGTGASAYRGQISYKHGDDYMNILTAGVEAMRVDSSQDAHFDQDVIAFSTTPSDIRLKENFEKIENGLDIVSQLEGHTFNWKKGGDRLSAGFKAQEVEKILPHLVDEKKLPLKADDDKEYKILRYEEMIPYLVESIKELKIVVETQQKEIKDLKNKL